MPILKSPKGREPWKCNDELAQKTGILHTVYSINGDEYTGEWLNNKKHGIDIFLLIACKHVLFYDVILVANCGETVTGLKKA